eukprot:scaffold24058_cov61-Phaeocystis_antarctica.AAC.4
MLAALSPTSTRQQLVGNSVRVACVAVPPTRPRAPSSQPACSPSTALSHRPELCLIASQVPMSLQKQNVNKWPSANAKQVSTHKNWEEARRLDAARQGQPRG